MRRAVIIVLALALIAAGCGGGGNGASPTMVATESSGSTGAVNTESPEDCLGRAGLSNVKQRSANLWRANNDDPFFAVFVEKLGTSQAKEAAQQADLVYAYPAGFYFVRGPLKSVDDEGITQTVADCLA